MTVNSIDDLQTSLRDQRYIADRGRATSIILALKLGRPRPSTSTFPLLGPELIRFKPAGVVFCIPKSDQ